MSRNKERIICTKAKHNKVYSSFNMKREYYKTKESFEEYIDLAKDVNGRQLIEKLVEILPPGSILLEIGSGPGTDWKILF